MQDSGMRRVLVTRDDRLQGIITNGDVSNWLRRMRELKTS
jgi:CBS domain-containing protein